MANYNDDTKIAVKIRQNTAKGEYNDSLYFTKDEFEALKDSDLEALIQARVDNWLAFVSTQSVREPTKEDLEAERAQKAQELAELDAKIADYEK